MARILIVEDEERIASFVAKGLHAEGHSTTVVADGREGLDEALSDDYDLMVLDIGLPSMDGFEVLDQLRAQGSRMPVIVLTARDSVTDTVAFACDSTANRSQIARRGKVPRGEFPVREMIEICVDKTCPAVLIIQVIRVLP